LELKMKQDKRVLARSATPRKTSRLIAWTAAACAAFLWAPFGCREGDADSHDSPSGTSEHATTQKSPDDGHDHGQDEHADEVTLTADAIERYEINIETASLYKLSPSFISPARVAFNAEAIAHVGSTLPGRVVELPIRLGDKVSKGDLLLVVESPQLGEAQSNYLQKLIAAETSKATVDLAKNALDRATRLYDQNRGIALDEVQKREGEFKATQAAVRTAEATATAAENTLHVLGMTQEAVEAVRASSEVNPRFPVVAPISGEVVEREVTLGELVSPEREKLLVLANVETLWVLADVPEAHIPELAIGAMAWINAGSFDPHKHKGEVSYVAPMIAPRTRTVSVRVAVECEDRSLKPGMFVEVEIASTDRDNPDPPPVVAVPQEAVQRIEGQPSVFVPVPGEENTFAKRSVQVGKPVAGLVPVLGGLVEGEAFVASGSFLLKADLGKATAEHQD
jgi:cobalt-zinc-cadmium efflux system membrane fusion protein